MRGPAGGIGLEGEKLLLQSKHGTPEGIEFEFASGRKQQALLSPPDPTAGFSLLVHGDGGAGHRSAFVALDPSLWKPIGKGSTPKGWRYVDKAGSRGGVRYARLGQNGRLMLKAEGDAFGFVPDGSDSELWVDVYVGNTRYCARFGDTDVQRNEDGLFKARGAEGPAACPEPVCGNNVEEVGEACDDGDLDPLDDCANDCTDADCQGDGFDSTFEAIQQVIIDGYGCASGFCHGDPAHPSGLHLLPGTEPGALDHNYEALLTGTPANQLGYDKFVVEGDPKASLLYQVLWKQANCGGADAPEECAALESEGVQSMPVGGALTATQLEAIELWISGAAPKDLVVAGTADKLDACLPPADPLKIDPPPPPGAGNGVQFVSSAWSLPSVQRENEVCFPIYYDFTQTALVPEDQQIDCPGAFGPLNPSNKCFRWHEQLLLQDPQSHHSIIHVYTGQYDVDHPAWGPWTYKMNGLDDPLNGQTCDPLAIDPATGQNVGCSGHPVRNAACLAYGPPDFNTGGQNGGTAPQVSGSQQRRYPQKLADGVYSVMPMQGIMVFNSHAFNLTDYDTTMGQYLNLMLAGPNDQKYQSQQIFDADDIFIQDVPPYETREYCATFTIDDGAKLFWLSSHTHRHGVRWRTWAPPNASCNPGSACGNAPCDPGSPGCACTPPPNRCAPPGPAGDDRLMYYSAVYNDPRQLAIEPPLPFTGSADERRFLFCSLFDNGSTPTSPPLKRQSSSPDTPFIFGGPCADEDKSCISPDPAKHGQLCASQPDPDRFCDSAPGAFDGFCDACPVKGGFTTEDEMFIKLGNFFVETPAP